MKTKMIITIGTKEELPKWYWERIAEDIKDSHAALFDNIKVELCMDKDICDISREEKEFSEGMDFKVLVSMVKALPDISLEPKVGLDIYEYCIRYKQANMELSEEQIKKL